MEHDFDDDAVCRHCGFDSAEWYWSKTHGDEFPWPQCTEAADGESMQVRITQAEYDRNTRRPGIVIELTEEVSVTGCRFYDNPPEAADGIAK